MICPAFFGSISSIASSSSSSPIGVCTISSPIFSVFTFRLATMWRSSADDTIPLPSLSSTFSASRSPCSWSAAAITFAYLRPAASTASTSAFCTPSTSFATSAKSSFVSFSVGLSAIERRQPPKLNSSIAPLLSLSKREKHSRNSSSLWMPMSAIARSFAAARGSQRQRK